MATHFGVGVGLGVACVVPIEGLPLPPAARCSVAIVPALSSHSVKWIVSTNMVSAKMAATQELFLFEIETLGS